MLTAIVGINWGDEGKGRMVDLLSMEQDIVVRYQGGNNAGHTVINHLGKFVLNLLPSGILRPEIVNVMGCGMVIDIQHLCAEMDRLSAAGVKITPHNLRISASATICMPYHVQQDCLEEARLGDKKFGSTKRGIAPVYSDKYMKKAIRIGDLLQPIALEGKVQEIVEWKNLTLQGYGAPTVDYREMYSWLLQYGEVVRPYIADTGAYLTEAAKQGKKIMFEAQLGALKDIDYGIYPYTSSSSTIAAYAPIGAGVPGLKLDSTIGIIKAYSSAVGEGAFVAELFGDEGDALREAGGEYGAATGRPRRVGPFDVVASAYGVAVQGANELALTKLDILSYLEEIPVCVAYEVDGVETQKFEVGAKLDIAKPVLTYLKGWNTDISGCRSRSELPKEALDYVAFIEEAVGCAIKYVSVGPEREACILMH